MATATRNTGTRVIAWLNDDVAVAAIRPSDMVKILFVSKFSVADPASPAPGHHGYQRDPEEARGAAIGKFFLKRSACAQPTPLTVSVRVPDPVDRREFERLFNAGRFEELRERFTDAVVSVVDGQHRSLGHIYANGKDSTYDPDVPIMMYFGLSIIQEAQLFDVINSTARKLPKALIETTKADIVEAGTKSYAQTVREIATSLARDDDSVWKGDVNMTGARKSEAPVTFEGLRRSTAAMFPKEVLERVVRAKKDPAAVASAYWRLVSETCSAAWNAEAVTRPNEDGEPIDVTPEYRIKELVGVAALSRLGRDIIVSSLDVQAFHGGSFDSQMATLVSKLQAVNWVKEKGNPWMQSQAGFSGQADLHQALYGWVFSGSFPGDDE